MAASTPSCSSSTHHGTVSTTPAAHTATSQSYFTRLDAIIKEFTIISSLQDGERLSQNFQSKAFVGKYDNPDKAYLPLGTRARQSIQRKMNGDSTEDAIQRIDTLANETLQLLQSIFTSYDFYSNFNLRLEKLQNLFELMDSSAQEGRALAKLCTTIETCSANARDRSQICKEERARKCHAAIEKVKTAAAALKGKLEEYNSIRDRSDAVSLPPMEQHIHEVIGKLLTPQVHGDYTSINVNAYKDLSCEIAVRVLSTYFGPSAVEDMLKLYNLNDKHRISYADLQALVVGIVANINIEDVRVMLGNEDLQKLLQLGSIRTEADLAGVLAKIRNVDIGGLENLKGSSYYLQLSGDLSFLKSCQAISDYNFTDSNFESRVHGLKLFGYTEHLSRFYSYALHETTSHKFRDGVLFPLYNDKGNLICREGHNIFDKDYIYCLGVLPVQGISENQEAMQVVFRGTFDMGSIIRDLNPWEQSEKIFWSGPGGTSFGTNQEELFANFLRKFEERPGLNQVEIMGHSLGGCDSMRFTALLATKLAEGNHCQDIRSVKLFGFNGPAVEEGIATKFIEDIRKLSNIDVHLRYFTTSVDYVSKFGIHFPGHSFGQERPSNLNISWIQFSHALKSHQSDSLRDLESGSVIAVQNSVKRRFDAHCHPYLSEDCVDEPGSMNPAYVNYFATTSEEDKERIGESARSKEVPIASLDQVLTTTFDYPTYKRLQG